MLQQHKVYVINLDRRPDRWETVSKSLHRAGFLDVERVSAVDGQKINSAQLQKLVHPSVFPHLGQVRARHEDLGSVGAVGCYLSHYKVWSMVAQSNQPAIVVEDDLLCHPLLDEFTLTQDPSELQHYDLVLLAGQVREPHLIRNRNYGRLQGIYPYRGLFFLLHFYYITPAAARFFLSGALPIQYQVDSYMGFKLQQDDRLRMGVHYPDMGSQSNVTTDIQTPMHHTSVPVVKDILVRVQTTPAVTWWWILLGLLLGLGLTAILRQNLQSSR